MPSWAVRTENTCRGLLTVAVTGRLHEGVLLEADRPLIWQLPRWAEAVPGQCRSTLTLNNMRRAPLTDFEGSKHTNAHTGQAGRDLEENNTFLSSHAKNTQPLVTAHTGTHTPVVD